MWKVAKYKILTLLEDNIFKVIIVLFFIILNYNVFIKSGILSDGNSDFNKILKYTLLINNFNIISTVFGLIVSVYIGSGLIGNDIASGKLYIMLTSFPRRWKYLMGNLLGLLITVTTFVVFILFNYFVCTVVLEVAVNVSDLAQCFLHIFLNMLVIMTVTAISSIFILGRTNIIIGLAELGIFNIYTYQKIPFVDYPLILKIHTRQILACLAPITNVAAPSINSDGTLTRYTVAPLLFGNMVVYQMVFLMFVAFIGILAFKYKEL